VFEFEFLAHQAVSVFAVSFKRVAVHFVLWQCLQMWQSLAQNLPINFIVAKNCEYRTSVLNLTF